MTKIIAIAGGSGSGKTTLAHRLCAALGSKRTALLSQDHYYIDQSARFDGDGGAVNFDHPDSIDFPLLASHLADARRGAPVEIPVYDFATHTRLSRTEPLPSREFLILEGTLVLSQSLIRDQVERAVYIEATETVRYQRRLHRDVRERGRSPDGVERQFIRQVKPMHDEYVETSKQFADLVVSGEGPLEQALQEVLAIVSAAVP